MSDHLNEAVKATLARMSALKEADDQLERRRKAIRAMHYEDGIPRSEVFLQLQNALRDRGLTSGQLEDAGVSHASIIKVLRNPST